MRSGSGRRRLPGLRRPARGFTWTLMLAAVALVGLAGSLAGPLWSHQQRREREHELLRIGVIYAQALKAYREASPGNDAQYPRRLEDLLLDTRHAGTRRHLRRLYPDPLSPSRPWGLVTDAQGRIVGLHSTDPAAPVAQGPVALADRTLPPAQRYSDWKFTALPSP